jgi:hypothetical protein
VRPIIFRNLCSHILEHFVQQTIPSDHVAQTDVFWDRNFPLIDKNDVLTRMNRTIPWTPIMIGRGMSMRAIDD